MAKRATIVTRNILVDAPLPEATKSYTVISHESVINTTLRLLDEKGFTVVEEIYKANMDAQVATGVFRLAYGNDPDLGLMFAFSNSYNKSLRFRCAMGGYVHLNGASIISTDAASWGRKHTGKADDETTDTITTQIDTAEAYFKQLLADKEAMKNIVLTERQFAELVGVLFVELNILSGEQVGIVKNEFRKPNFTYTSSDNSLWTLYNHILVALAKSHPKTWMEQQKVVHFHLISNFDITQFDDEEDITPDKIQMGELDKVSDEKPETFVEKAEAQVMEQYQEGSANLAMEGSPAVEEEVHSTPSPILPNIVSVQEGIKEVVTELSKVTEEVIPKMPDPSKSDMEAMDAILAEKKTIVLPKPILPGFTQIPDPIKEPTVNLSDLEGEFTPEEIPAGSTLPTYKEVIIKNIEEQTKLNEITPADELAEKLAETESVVINDNDIFVNKSDLLDIKADVELTDIILLGDDEYEVIKSDVLEGSDGYYLRKLVIESEPEAKSFALGKELPEELLEEAIEDPIPEPVKIAEEVLETVDEIKEEIEEIIAEIEKPIVKTDENPQIRTIIAKELHDLYGTIQEFTYVVVDGQYNVTLETNEVVCLLKREIDSRIV